MVNITISINTIITINIINYTNNIN